MAKGLGKGLDSLISTKYSKQGGKETKPSAPRKEGSDNTTKEEKKAPANTPLMLSISSVTPNREQPRKTFDEKALAELSESIKRHGIIAPLVVRKLGNGYEIIAGERRFRAAQLAGLREVPAIVKDYTEQEVNEIALIENIQRENLNSIEEAQAYLKLINEFGLTQEQLAERISKSRSSITNHLRLLKLSPKIQQMITDGELTEGHARCLLSVTFQRDQEKLATTIVAKNLSVREAEALVKKYNAPKKKKIALKDPDAEIYSKIEDRLREELSAKVAIKRESGEKGKIVIDYYSLEELERLMDIFHKGNEA